MLVGEFVKRAGLQYQAVAWISNDHPRAIEAGFEHLVGLHFFRIAEWYSELVQ